MLKSKKKKVGERPFLTVEFEKEVDGRWIAEVPELPGVMAYGATKQTALRRVYAIALRMLADKADEGRISQKILSRFFVYEMANR